MQELEKIKNRNKLDIICDILVSSTGGVKKTHIVSRANLSSEQMTFYFNTLLHHIKARLIYTIKINPSTALKEET